MAQVNGDHVIAKIAERSGGLIADLLCQLAMKDVRIEYLENQVHALTAAQEDPR